MILKRLGNSKKHGKKLNQRLCIFLHLQILSLELKRKRGEIDMMKGKELMVYKEDDFIVMIGARSFAKIDIQEAIDCGLDKLISKLKKGRN